MSERVGRCRSDPHPTCAPLQRFWLVRFDEQTPRARDALPGGPPTTVHRPPAPSTRSTLWLAASSRLSNRLQPSPLLLSCFPSAYLRMYVAQVQDRTQTDFWCQWNTLSVVVCVINCLPG